MSLADLIQRKKTATVSSPATATLAIPATDAPFPADIPPSVAKVATVAVENNKTTEILGDDLINIEVTATTEKPSLYCKSGDCHCSQKLPAANYPAGCSKYAYFGKPPVKRGSSPDATETDTFEQTGDPVSCKYWYQVCWAVGMYQEQCKRNSGCIVYNFLKRNT
jgi:hypothetical protein